MHFQGRAQGIGLGPEEPPVAVDIRKLALFFHGDGISDPDPDHPSFFY